MGFNHGSSCSPPSCSNSDRRLPTSMADELKLSNYHLPKKWYTPQLARQQTTVSNRLPLAQIRLIQYLQMKYKDNQLHSLIYVSVLLT